MESCSRRVLLLLGMAVVATALAPPQDAVSYEEALSLAIDLYNQESKTDFAFRLLEAKPQPEWNPWIGAQELEFSVKETTCPASKLPSLQECDFKEDNGLVETCSGTLAVEQGEHVIQLDCETATEEHARVRRGGFRKLRRKLKKAIKKGIKSILRPRPAHIQQGGRAQW